MPLHNRTYSRLLTEPAKQLRRNMTPQEQKLWFRFLRNYPVKVYKQRVIGRFIADFFCASARLVIEIDGSQHYTSQGLAHDEERTAFLEGQGLCVLRYTNQQIDEDFSRVCQELDRAIQERRSDPESQRR